MGTSIHIGQSNAGDPVEAVRELHDQLFQPNMELVVFFCATTYDLNVIAREINSSFRGVRVVGCTTAGEIGPMGYLDRSLTGISFPSGHFTAVSGRIDQLQSFAADQGEALVGILLTQLETLAPDTDEKCIFAFQMVDGLSLREESVTRAFQYVLGRIPLVGGSAGDAENFAHTYVFSEGHFHEDSAVLVVAASSLPFMTFSTHHFVATDRRAVVTAADPASRTALEIDGLPATEGYARLVGVHAGEVGPAFFTAHPLVVRIAGSDHARAIQKANPDGSLTLYAAIEEGVVLRAATRGDLVTDLEGAFTHLHHHLGDPSLVLVCDCILRNLEITQLGLRDPVTQIFRRNNAVGFATYGEQLHGVHVSQTMTGIAFGSVERK
jgi:hypothetical protein